MEKALTLAFLVTVMKMIVEDEEADPLIQDLRFT
jgi:hypothetical protein